jgi:hypothetical protein
VTSEKKSSSLSNKIFPFNFQPAPAWLAIVALIVLSSLFIFTGIGGILNLAFPVGSFIVGLFLYLRYPILYVGFTWWLWFLTPLVRRLGDWKSGVTDPSPILLAPLLVALISSITLILQLPKLYKHGNLPFFCCLASVFYGFLIGLIQNSTVTTIIEFLDWVSPIFFGFHLFTCWRDYPQ